MQINIYKDKLLGARLFGASVLYSVQPIPREDVPKGWYCYDLRGTARHPDEPYALVDQTEDCHAGSVLSYLPLKSGRSEKRLVKNMFQMLGTNPTLAEFCADERITAPEVPLRHMLCPASPKDAGLFYAQTPERDTELGAIGHVRIDFGSGGKGFCHSWWPRGPEELNTQEFKDELGKVVDDLRKSVLKDLSSMRRYCYGSKGAIEGGSCCQNYGFTLETERFLYRLRCNPIEGDYQAYLSCFDKQAQQMLDEGHAVGQAASGMTMGGMG
ncbi:LPD28 domain-containing protein [Pseudoflavonifractor sp. 60]|uniref:LPD28 domain-containing protein n=1 Tax=Pseudoflavonifractor sp. 60 TaxID=2304576 RepID=UPI0013708D79|nr:LPD28 domain-containing protein [Pseudoflavonifractor sp. 60]